MLAYSLRVLGIEWRNHHLGKPGFTVALGRVHFLISSTSGDGKDFHIYTHSYLLVSILVGWFLYAILHCICIRIQIPSGREWIVWYDAYVDDLHHTIQHVVPILLWIHSHWHQYALLW